MLKLYFICGSSNIVGRQFEDVLEQALKAGITLFQFREKGPGSLDGEEKRQLAQRLKKLCHAYNVPFIVNDDWQLALDIDADGIHLGQDDEKIETIIEKFEHKIIGLSVSNFEEYDQSDLQHVDYIGVGPVYATSSKSDAKKPGGIELIRKMRLYDKEVPIVAIGGITNRNCEMILKAGADGISTISSIAASGNIEQDVKSYLDYYK
ncbi:thiamine phosphate synthase [Macrococcus hajekii]|uniref:Thiamine-phosphate synthase n=2 Tax=Macrococcus hajekii TaxID=198482 RepID=A0A4R6BHT6_9STAP|nr:thiamine phosphate synthase [Macrococcus hajekii]TDM01151.1 thiamine phosphate synthase [Macrococcus hajekii]